MIKEGYGYFISGMAIGFDTWAAEEVLKLKSVYSYVNLECALPFPEQNRKWDMNSKIRYKEIISNADHCYTICNHYNKFCFFIRNEYMVRKADIILCCYDGQKGGTSQTVNYAKKLGKLIIQINPKDISVSVIEPYG